MLQPLAGVRRARIEPPHHHEPIRIRRRALQGVGVGGVVVGVPAALMGSAVLQSLMFGLSTTDRVTLAIAVVIVALVGAAASAVPAVRASRVDPVQLLRAE